VTLKDRFPTGGETAVESIGEPVRHKTILSLTSHGPIAAKRRLSLP
jgi:hypothetical protein